MGQPFMVPVVDFLNTSVPSKINAAVHFEADATVVRLLPGVSLKKGDQVAQLLRCFAEVVFVRLGSD